MQRCWTARSRYPAELVTLRSPYPAELVTLRSRYPAELVTLLSRYPAELVTLGRRYLAELVTLRSRYQAENGLRSGRKVVGCLWNLCPLYIPWRNLAQRANVQISETQY